jgi:hypothetical protein
VAVIMVVVVVVVGCTDASAGPKEKPRR